MSVGRETARCIRKLCRSLVLEYPKDRYDPKRHPFHMSGYVPEDINKEQPPVDLYGKYYLLYKEALNHLRKELALEYLRDRDLKDSLWHFVCEVITNISTFKDFEKLDGKISEFLSGVVRPIEEFEVLVPILGLDLKDAEIQIGQVVLKKSDEKNLEEWTGLHKKECDPDIYSKFANRSVAAVHERGNNHRSVCDRARERVNFTIRVLQVALTTNPFIHDEETLFKQSEWIAYKRNNVIEARWKRGYRPILREIDVSLGKNIGDFLRDIADVLVEERLPPRLRKCFVRSLTWVGRSIEEENIDIKIVYLSTALESILSTRDDEKKGETLAYRMLLLNVFLDETFAHPARILWIYELRSRIIHGSEISIASKRDYYTVRRVARNTIRYALEVVQRTSVIRKSEFIRVLESQNENIKRILDWLSKQGDELSIRIKRHMENRLLSRT